MSPFALRKSALNGLDALVPETMFRRALCLERKRAERSRKLFALMLLEAGEPFQNGNGDNALHKTASSIIASIRETDIAGWYQEPSTVGVIFAELGAADK